MGGAGREKMKKENKRLGQRAWDALERPQGLSFYSDALCSEPDDEVAAFLVYALPHAQKVVTEMRRLLREYTKTLPPIEPPPKDQPLSL
jgi:hypothetical protein